MPEQRTVAYDNLMQQPDVPIADQRASELVALHNLIQDIAQKKIDNCINLPRIYTMVCYGHTENNAVKAVFPQDVEATKVDSNGKIMQVVCNTSKVMTFPNYSGYNPVVGQGVLILTTGGISPTGGFVIAVMGFPNVFMTGLNSELNELRQEVLRNVDRIDGDITELNTKIEGNTTAISNLRTETNNSMNELQNTIDSSVTSQLNSIKSRLSSLESQISQLSDVLDSLPDLTVLELDVQELYDVVQPQLAKGTKVFGGASFSKSIIDLLAEHDQMLRA